MKQLKMHLHTDWLDVKKFLIPLHRILLIQNK